MEVTENTAQSREQTSKRPKVDSRRSKGQRPEANVETLRTWRRARRRMQRKKKKGETAVYPQIHPRITIPEITNFAKLISRNLM
jgi:hypothetical protein